MYKLEELFADIKPDYDKIMGLVISNHLESCYVESPIRIYHTLQEHIFPGLDLLEEYQDKCEDYNIVRFAWWYHDILHYVIDSGIRARTDWLFMSLDDKKAEILYNLVIRGTDHDGDYAETNDECIIHDVDLAILGSSWEKYEKYAHMIRKEYSYAIDEQFNFKRKLFMRGILKGEKIYETDWFQERFGERARKNIQKEIDQLEF